MAGGVAASPEEAGQEEIRADEPGQEEPGQEEASAADGAPQADGQEGVGGQVTADVSGPAADPAAADGAGGTGNRSED